MFTLQRPHLRSTAAQASPISLTITGRLLTRLMAHLFPGDGDEHGAVIAAGIVETPRGTRLLARELFLAQDGTDYVPGTHGYRALSQEFVARVSDYCARERLCYLAVHNHGGRDRVAFSDVDMASHERGYPALLDITDGGPIGALVFAENAVAGDIWFPRGRLPLDFATVVGPHNVRRLYPGPAARPPHADLVYDRHARLFGDAGQAVLREMKVGIIGAGGGGSLLSEWLARLGVGHIVAVDFDRVDVTNLPRIAGASRWDAMAPLVRSGVPWLERLGKRWARHKVAVARRVARLANPSIRFDAVVGDVMDEDTARLLADTDFLFLASDTMQSRLVFNALVQQYLVPGVQIGAKVTLNQHRSVEDALAVTRPVLPGAGSGCLECHGLIDPAALQREGLSDRERQAQRYVEDAEVAEPSVITLNALSAAQAVNDLLFLFTGLFLDGTELQHQMHFARERLLTQVDFTSAESCPDCSTGRRSRYARGDRHRLPCRMGPHTCGRGHVAS